MPSVFIQCLLVALALLHIVDNGNAANILAVFPVVSAAHSTVVLSLLDKLTRRGHKVTLISAFPIENLHYKSMTHIYLKGLKSEPEAQIPSFISLREEFYYSVIKKMTQIAVYTAEYTVEHPKVQQLLKQEDKHFDLIIIEAMGGEILQGFAEHYNCPVIAFSVQGTNKWVTDLVRSPSRADFVPFYYRRETIFLRPFYYLWGSYMEYCVKRFHYLPARNRIYERRFRPVYRPLVTVALVNNYKTIMGPSLSDRNIVEVGGFHVMGHLANTSYLEPEIREFLKGARHGFILFSLGVQTKTWNIPRPLMLELLAAFALLKQHVLLKWEGVDMPIPNMPKIPKNVFIYSYYPQDMLLAMLDCRLLITHGGHTSMTEARYHGVPFIGIPLFGEQYITVADGVADGWGVQISYSNLTGKSLLWAMKEVLYDGLYRMQGKLLSIKYRRQSEMAMNIAVQWVEIVAKRGMNLDAYPEEGGRSWFEVFYIDLFVIACLILFAAVYLVLHCALPLYYDFPGTMRKFGRWIRRMYRKIRWHWIQIVEQERRRR